MVITGPTLVYQVKLDATEWTGICSSFKSETARGVRAAVEELFNIQWRNVRLDWDECSLTIRGTDPMVGSCVEKFRQWVTQQVERRHGKEVA